MKKASRRAGDAFVLRVVFKSSRGNVLGASSRDWRSLRRDDSVDVACFEGLVIRAVGVGAVAGYGLHLLAGVGLDAFNLRDEFFAFARFAGGDGYVHDDAAFIFDSGVLFVRRLEVVLLARGRHVASG